MLYFTYILFALSTFLPHQSDVPTLTPTAVWIDLTIYGTPATETPTPTPTLTLTPTSTPTPSMTPTPTVTPSPTSTPTPQPFKDHYSLYRPVPANSEYVVIDRTYPYGGTQRGTFQVHSGVEFFNARFSPVIAADAGVVVFAGTDDRIEIGKHLNYYGNVVIIDHGYRSPEGTHLYTLYGHLEDVMVTVGQSVIRGEQVGRVGATGVALGSHLHFEVRVGDPFDFYATRNPDLYLYPMEDTAMLVGLVKDTEGNLLPEVPIMIRRMGGLTYETYTYGADLPNSSNMWGENFTRGDVRAGDYEVTIRTHHGQTVFKQSITLSTDNATWLEIVIPPNLQFYPELNRQTLDQLQDYPTETPTNLPPNFTPSPTPTPQSFG